MMLLLDLDDTLAECDAALQAWLTTWLNQYPGEQREAMRSYLTQEAAGLYPTEMMTGFYERFTPPQTVEALLTDFTDGVPRHYRVVPGAAEAMAGVRRAGWRLGVVTNGPSLLQRGKVTHMGLEELVDAVIISGEVGIDKPDPAIFALAADRLRVPAGSGWMVGDNPESDIGGAHQAGLRSVWLHRGRTWDQEWPADLVADDLPTALRLIRSAG